MEKYKFNKLEVSSNLQWRIGKMPVIVVIFLCLNVVNAQNPNYAPEDYDMRTNLFIESILKSVFGLISNNSLVQDVLDIATNALSTPKKDLNWFTLLFPGQTNLIEGSINTIFANIFSLQISKEQLTTCDRDLLGFKKSLLEPWMIEVIDSLGKPPAGILRGNLLWPGAYDQCMMVYITKTPLITPGTRSKYCLMKVEMTNNMTFETGICVPSTCDDHTLHSHDRVFANIIEKIPFVGNAIDERTKISYECFDYVERTLDAKAIICILVLVLLGSFSFIGSTYDCYLDWFGSEGNNDTKSYLRMELPNEEPLEEVKEIKEKTLSSVFVNENGGLLDIESKEPTGLRGFILCFSIWRNGAWLLSGEKQEGYFQCLSGIRVLTLAWVVLTQAYYYLWSRGYTANIKDMYDYSETWHSQVILRGDHAADTFLLMSGFLVTYYYLMDEVSNSLLSILQIYIKRLIRLSPMYIIVVYFYMSVFPYFGEGPYWRTIEKQTKACQENWWYNLFYINNFQPNAGDNICLRPTWYLSVEMQCLLISPIFLVLLKCKRKYLGLSMIFLMLIGSWVITGIISYQNDLNVSMYGYSNSLNTTEITKQEKKVFENITIKPYTRIGPYLIGALLGFLIKQLNGAKGFLSTMTATFIWIGAIAVNLAITYGLYNSDIGLVTKSVYNSISHSVWALTIAWVIFACVTENCGAVDIFLSWELWISLGKMTFGAFLVHSLVLDVYYGNLKVPIYFTNTVMSVHFLGLLTLSFGVAFIFSLLFEVPITQLKNFIINKKINTD